MAIFQRHRVADLPPRRCLAGARLRSESGAEGRAVTDPNRRGTAFRRGVDQK
ncbi:MAG: hypothetical protein ACQXXL_04545 [Candidatus Methanosuratincola sp.]|nr:hypothetical protein [Candidatus Methanosuratincola sp.]